METIIDYSILDDFFKTQPEPVPIGDEHENEQWLSLWRFLKEGTNLSVFDFKLDGQFDMQFFKHLTTGRNEDCRLMIDEKPFAKPYKFELRPKDYRTFYCLSFDEENDQKELVRKNGYLVSFKQNYKQKWEEFRLLGKITTGIVRKSKITFSSWTDLKPFLTPFTDVVVVDNYIFADKSLIPSNFEKLLGELSKATNSRFQLSIYTFEERSNIKAREELFQYLKELIYNNNLRCDVQLIFSPSQVKEHDRGVFTNYLRIKSGDSFNYFNSNGEVTTHGTEIEFKSMADPILCNAADAVLRDLAITINNLKNESGLKCVFGENKNRLLDLKLKVNCNE